MARRRKVPAALLLGAVLLLSACAGGTGADGPRTPPAAPSGAAPSAAEGGPAAGERPRRAFTLLATGDVIPYPWIIRQARSDADGEGYDFRPILSGVAPLVQAADVALCHLETPSGDEDGPFTGFPLFRSPPQLAAALRDTGYTGCSTASNHTLDDGVEGVRRTLDALDAAGVRHAGSARDAREAERHTVLRAGGARIAHLSYTADTNGIPVPAAAPWSVNLLEPRRVVADARAARRAGADVVVVSVHWGTEWQTEPDSRQLATARALTAARTAGERDIDLVLGTHNHVAQAYEKVNGTWVVYGLGDQMASFVPSLYRGNEGSMARFTFVPRPDGGRWEVRKAEYLVGHSVMGPPFRVVRATSERHPEVHARVSQAVLSRGAAADGLREAD